MRNRVLSTYLEEIAELSPLSIKDEKQLIRKIKLGDSDARNRVVTMCLKYVVSIAKLYQGRGVPLGDLIDEGSLGLLRALKTYDPSKGVRFISYAAWWIRQHILKIIYQQAKAVKVSVQKLASKKTIMEIESELSQKLGRMPSTEEIAKALGLSTHEVDQAIQVAQSDFSLNTQIGQEEVSLLDFIKASPEKLEDYAIRELFEGELREKLNELSEPERSVTKLYFGLNGKEPHTLEEIGKMFNLSRERIRQIKAKALRKLRPK
ncbi:MAG: RNA polymerase sigma factor RpoD/SigA [bacterium]|nr:RNA polymerase sigma factor RpoD/SigA [bacterium]